MEIKDAYGRRFSYLRLSITEMCNFRCNYCLPNGNHCDTPKGGLSLAQIETLVSAFAKMGTKKIRITGGEPSLRKDLFDIIALCKDTEGIEQVALTTNAFRLNKDALHYKNAGLDALNVSADSLDPRMFQAITGKNALEDILRGVDIALDAGIKRIKFNSVILKSLNYKDLDAFFDYLKTHAVTWRFIELMQTGNNEQFFKQNHVAGDAIKRELLTRGWQAIERDRHAGPAEEFSHCDYAGNIGLIMPYSKDFCSSCNRLRVSSQGKLHLCLFAEQGFDLLHHLDNGDVDATIAAVSQYIGVKKESHYLQEGKTGATTQLAMLGG